MKNNNELILKYLSGLLNEKEIIAFDERLKTDQKFNEEFENTRRTIDGFQLDQSMANEQYFVNLIPKLRERIDKQRKFFNLKKLYVVAPALTIILAIIIFYPRSSNDFHSQYKELAEIVANNITDNEVSEKYLNDNSFEHALANNNGENFFSLGFDNEIVELPTTYNTLYGFTSTETIMTISELPEETVNNLYNELKEVKFK